MPVDYTELLTKSYVIAKPGWDLEDRNYRK